MEDIKKIRDNGPWEASKVYYDGSKSPYYQDDVWRYNCKWRCIVDKTTEAPGYGSTAWTLITGDDSLSLDFYSDVGTFYRYNREFKANIEVKVLQGTENITEHILDGDWKWSRDSGDINADNAWAVKHANTTNKITITEEDLDIDTLEGIDFICEVFVRYGAEVKRIKESFKI